MAGQLAEGVAGWLARGVTRIILGWLAGGVAGWRSKNSKYFISVGNLADWVIR